MNTIFESNIDIDNTTIVNRKQRKQNSNGKLNANIAKQMLDDYFSSNMSLDQVTKKYGASQYVGSYWLKKFNLKSKPYPIDDKKICERILYLHMFGYIQKEITDITGISHSTILKIFRKYDIKPHKIGGYKGYHKYDCNKEYFYEINSHNKAYILGLIATDGNIVANRGSFTFQLFLQKRDSHLIDSIKSELCYTGPTEERVSDKWGHPTIQYGFRINSKDFCKNLINKGIIPNKTFCLEFPKCIDKEFLPSFIRGVIDGDGFWSHTYNRKRKIFPCVGIVSASFSFIKEIKNYLFEVLPSLTDVTIHEHIENRKNPLYSLRFNSLNDCYNLYKLVYSNSDIYLNRKKEKIEYILNVHKLPILINI